MGKSVQPLERLLQHPGRALPYAPDTVGQVILENMPVSLFWSMDLYTLSDCRDSPSLATDVAGECDEVLDGPRITQGILTHRFLHRHTHEELLHGNLELFATQCSWNFLNRNNLIRDMGRASLAPHPVLRPRARTHRPAVLPSRLVARWSLAHRVARKCCPPSRHAHAPPS